MISLSLFLRLAFVMCALGFLTACGPTQASTPVSQPPPVSGPDVKTGTPIEAGKTAILAVEAQGKALKYDWSAVRGKISGTDNTATYTAPASAGSDVVTVKVTSDGGTTTKTLTLNIVAYTPTPPPSSTPVPPTSTPIPSPTLTPRPTLTPTAMPTKTPPPTPFSGPVFAEPFPQAIAGQNFVFKNNDAQVIETYPNQCAHSGQYGLRLTYDKLVGQGNGGWGISWENSPSGYFDVSKFTNLVFWVKGERGGEKFQIGLKDTSEFEVKVESDTLLRVSASDWTLVTVPLNKFNDKGKYVNLASIRNVNVGFNSDHGPGGTICIDDIAFQ